MSTSLLQSGAKALRDLVQTQEREERRRQDEAADAARQELEAFNRSPVDLKKRAAARAMAEAKVTKAKAELAAAEAALSQSRAEEYELIAESEYRLKELRAASLAPYRIELARERLTDAMLSYQQARNSGRAHGEGSKVLAKTLQQLTMIASGNADAPADLDTFVDSAIARAQAAFQKMQVALEEQERLHAEAERQRQLYT